MQPPKKQKLDNPWAVPPTVFDDMTCAGTCQAATGYPSAHLAYVWNQYCEFLEPVNWRPSWFTCRRGRSYTQTVIHFYFVFVYIHCYPRQEQCPSVLRARGMQTGLSHRSFSRNVMPIALALAVCLREVVWSDRLDPFNHHPYFPVGVTTIWDMVPLYVATPADKRQERLIYQPKYKNCVFKMEVAVTFSMQIVYFSGPHLGTANDNEIFNQGTRSGQHVFEEYEYGLGDKIYQTAEHILAGHRNPPGGSITDAQRLENDKLDFCRSAVERVFAALTDHAAFHTRPGFRGTLEALTAFAYITIHVTAALFRHQPSRQPAKHGPWSHDWRV